MPNGKPSEHILWICLHIVPSHAQCIPLFILNLISFKKYFYFKFLENKRKKKLVKFKVEIVPILYMKSKNRAYFQGLLECVKY